MSAPAPRVRTRPRKTLGIGGVILLAQLFFLIPTIVGTTLLPGQWTSYEPEFELYIIMDLVAIGLIFGFGSAEKEVREGSISDFLIRGVVWGFATWLALTFIFGNSIVSAGTAKVPILVYTGFFVGPTEELLFRVVLPSIGPTDSKGNPKLLWAIFTSGGLFAAYHVWTYGLTALTPSALIGALAFPFILGLAFYGIYRYAPFGGYGAVSFVHFVYDAFVFGSIAYLHLVPAWAVPL